MSVWSLSRASGVDMNPMQLSQRANQFASSTKGFDSTTLLLTRDADGMHGHLVTVGSGADSRTAATHLAHAVGARADEAEFPEGLVDENVVGWLVFESGSSVSREAQVGMDPMETARLLANSMPHGSWVAISMRRPSKGESRRHKTWLGHRMGASIPTHHSMSPDSMVISVYAGGEDAAVVTHLLDSTRAAMPGFDLMTYAKVATRRGAALPAWATAAVSATVGAGLHLASVTSALLAPGASVALVLWLVGTLRFYGVLGSPWKRTRTMALTGEFERPRKRRWFTRKPRKEVTSGPKPREAREGDYPLASSSFLAGPQVFVGVVAPQAGAVSGESSSKSRGVPPLMLRRVGPLVGDSADGPVFLSADDTKFGVAVLGAPGSGKTQLLRSLFAWASLDRVRPANVGGFPGRSNVLIAFESKGDGVRDYRKWAAATGDALAVVDIAEPGAWAIDLFDVPGNAAEKANFFANAMAYAFTDGAIQDRSFETLVAVFTAALALTPEIAGRAEGVDATRSPVYFAHVLLGGRGSATGVALAAEVSHAAVQSDASADIKDAAVALAPLYQNKTEAARNNLTEAPRNKVGQLLALEGWWSSPRKFTWGQVFEHHRALVINTGTSATGQVVPERLGQQMSSLLMFSLQNAIQRHCSGWEKQNRWVSIFSDELSLLAGSSPEVLTWLRDQGRSYGVRPFLATQRPEQLPDRVRTAMLTFATLVSYKQDDVKTAREVAEQVSGEDGEVSATDILHLEPFTAMVRAQVGQRRQSPFTVKVRNFEAARERFAADQGYVSLPVMGAGEALVTEQGAVSSHAASVAAQAASLARMKPRGQEPAPVVDEAAPESTPAATAAPVVPPVPGPKVLPDDDDPPPPVPNLMDF